MTRITGKGGQNKGLVKHTISFCPRVCLSAKFFGLSLSPFPQLQATNYKQATPTKHKQQLDRELQLTQAAVNNIQQQKWVTSLPILTFPDSQMMYYRIIRSMSILWSSGECYAMHHHQFSLFWRKNDDRWWWRVVVVVVHDGFVLFWGAAALYSFWWLVCLY